MRLLLNIKTMTITSKKFARLIDKYEEKLTSGLSPEKLLTVDFMDLNKQAIKLAQKEIQGL